MIKKILAFFSDESVTAESLSVDESAAVLLIEVMMADHDLDQRETQCIQQILSKRMNVAASEVQKCLEIAMSRHDETHDMHEFVRVINDQYGEDERFELLVDLWRVAYADGRLDKYEDHRIRRLTEWMHLHHSHFIRAKSLANPKSD